MANPSRNTTAGRVFNDLRNTARRQGRGTDELLVAYVLERWLYRVSISAYRDQFILKGGLLLAALNARRSTRDGDLLGRIDSDESFVVSCVREIASLAVDDGLEFHTEQIRVQAIREQDHYAGLRVTMPVLLGRAQVKLALDINFGDPVTPGAVRIPYPGVLERGTFEILAYPIETVLAEKLTTAISLGEANTRERDWADIWRLTGSNDLQSDRLIEALQHTSQHRAVQLTPLSQRIGSLAELRNRGYQAWRRRQAADTNFYPSDMRTVVDDVTAFADPLLTGETFQAQWRCKDRTWNPAQ